MEVSLLLPRKIIKILRNPFLREEELVKFWIIQLRLGIPALGTNQQLLPIEIVGCAIASLRKDLDWAYMYTPSKVFPSER